MNLSITEKEREYISNGYAKFRGGQEIPYPMKSPVSSLSTCLKVTSNVKNVRETFDVTDSLSVTLIGLEIELHDMESEVIVDIRTPIGEARTKVIETK